MTDNVTSLPDVRKIRRAEKAFADFRAALSNLENLQSNYNREHFAQACAEMIAEGGSDDDLPLSSVASYDEMRAVVDAFGITIDNADTTDEVARKVVSMTAARKKFGKYSGQYGRLRPVEEQRAHHIAEALLANVKDERGVDAALLQWQQQFKEQPEMVRAICDFFFYRCVWKVEGEAAEPGDE
jgi:hypothetical protein